MGKAVRKKKETVDELITSGEEKIVESLIEIVEESKNDFPSAKLVTFEAEVQYVDVTITENPVSEINTNIVLQDVSVPMTLTQEEKIKAMPIVFQVKETMSDQATKWEKYISIYRFTPETFLEKYPYHIHRKFIEEIIQFRKK